MEKVWFDLANEFAANGHDVWHVSKRYPGLPDHAVVGGVEHVRVGGFSQTHNGLVRLIRDLTYSTRVAAAISDADVIVTHSFWSPVILRNTRAVLYVHVARFPKQQHRLYRSADRLQAVSSPVAEALVQQGVPSTKVVVIPNPVRLPELRSTSENPVDDICFAGRIHPEKGVLELLRAVVTAEGILGRPINVRLAGPTDTAAGGGGRAYFEDLKRVAVRMRGSVDFRGLIVDREELNRYISGVRIFAYPSLAERGETFGLAVLEAMSLGVPALVSDLRCFLDFVLPGRNGMVWDRASGLHGLAQALSTALDQEGRIEQMGMAARRTAEGFTVEKVAGMYLADFESAIA
ncbi:glycosyltransferase family 4 protein [Euzebya sp.]|uniref:glycosyltransferase family 4 protein n=1 Tax=Euzebya sp. TaxID=1971409 RepID=UPI0035150C2B